MENASFLGEVVRAWAIEVLDGDAHGAARAVAVGEAAYRRGAPVSEACREVRDFVASWAWHPSRCPPRHAAALVAC